MKSVSSALVLLFIFFSSCQEKPVGPVVNECVGSSTYYIKNESDYPLSVAFLTTPPVGSKTDTISAIAGRTDEKIASDAIFGAIPKPTDTFAVLTLFREVDGKKVVVYRQDPVRNAAWVKQKQNPNDPDFGCYAVSYTLTVTNQDLK
jgi:hypothetical protein